MPVPEENDDLLKRKEVAEAAARASGAFHIKYLSSVIDFETKADPRDVLTRADLEGQVAAKAVIEAAFPGENIVGEEDGLSYAEMERLFGDGCWLIDPLDGTQSYVHAFPAFAAGVAYVKGEASLVGAIYDAVHDDMYSAARGHGATFNAEACRVTPAKTLDQALVGIHIREVGEEAVEMFLRTTGNLLPRAHGIRLLGCPMLTMAYIATARLDAFAMLSPSKLGPWDLAPAIVMLEEAGGIVAEGMTGRPLRFSDRGIAGASSKELLDEMFAVARGEE
jgi:myo-inositol-1(or 4)-monophosphatase